MQIPETPAHIQDLDLMQRLAAYGSGAATYLTDNRPLGVEAQKACKLLHANLESLDRTLAPLLAKVTAREMSTFTAHDPLHARKVAHLMWHITAPARRSSLTPPEIGLLIAAAYIHDLGMFLSPDEREQRLAPGSDLWDCLEVDPATRTRLDEFATGIAEEEEKKQKLPLGSPEITAATQRQAQEALLCADNRSRHALPERYASLLQELRAVHAKEPATIVSPDAALAFQGDSFLHQLLDICASHNEAAHALVTRHPQHADRPRFARDFPVGSSTADLQFIAAALRLADILDFDRERTPPVLFHYFIPGALAPTEDDRSALEWSKHLAITHWHIDEAKNEIVFRARCHSHIVHHGIVHFCAIIGTEITETLSTFPAAEKGTLFALPTTARADIHAEGYTYAPYRFELDDDRIYRLLMGGSIYDNPLHAIRELIQNAVDACLYRDAHEQLHNPASTPRTDNRITITYTEPTLDHPYPTLEVADTGSGMDEHTLTNYFLKVGRSFYNSPEFNQFRVRLRKEGSHDFAPVSEFGIGFLSSFLLADKVEVITALWKPLHGDTQKRTLEIHGPTRLMRLKTEANNGAKTFSGTSVKLTLTKGCAQNRQIPPTKKDVQNYLSQTCVMLPYILNFTHIDDSSERNFTIAPQGLEVKLPEAYEEHAIRIQVEDSNIGFKGQIVLFNLSEIRELNRLHIPNSNFVIEDSSREEGSQNGLDSRMIRGGFHIGPVPGIPRSYTINAQFATVSLDWKSQSNLRHQLTNLSRTSLANVTQLEEAIAKSWFSWLINNIDDVPAGWTSGHDLISVFNKISGSVKFSAYQIYKLAANSWHPLLTRMGITDEAIQAWEESKGDAIPYKESHRAHYSTLLDLMMPKVSRVCLDELGAYYIFPPENNWKQVLSSCYDYAGSGADWGTFISYVGGAKHRLFVYSYHLNIKYKERVENHFNQNEIKRLIPLLRHVFEHREDKRVTVTNDQLSLLRRAQQHLGDLEIGFFGVFSCLNTLQLPKL